MQSVLHPIRHARYVGAGDGRHALAISRRELSPLLKKIGQYDSGVDFNSFIHS